jgi:hypothetical protein
MRSALTGTYRTADLGSWESGRAKTSSSRVESSSDQAGVARMLDEEKKQVEAGNGAVPNSAGGRARTMDFKARVSVTLESRPRSSSKNIGKIYLTLRAACPYAFQIGGPAHQEGEKFPRRLPTCEAITTPRGSSFEELFLSWRPGLNSTVLSRMSCAGSTH